MDMLISQYIDDELSLSEKKVFVQQIHKNERYFNETVDLIQQEELLVDMDAYPEPMLAPVSCIEPAKIKRVRWPVIYGMGLIAASVLFFVFYHGISILSSPERFTNYRFVIYSPDAEKVEITGTFTRWNRVLMERGAQKGYWHVNVSLSGGEHRFSYIINGEERITDPTILSREKDDFGGENSILRI